MSVPPRDKAGTSTETGEHVDAASAPHVPVLLHEVVEAAPLAMTTPEYEIERFAVVDEMTRLSPAGTSTEPSGHVTVTSTASVLVMVNQCNSVAPVADTVLQAAFTENTGSQSRLSSAAARSDAA